MYATQPDPRTGPQSSRRLILHVGMHKTGSTTIQHVLNGGVLRNARYFKGPKANHSLLFRMMFEDNPESHRMHRLQGRGREEVLRIGAEQRAGIAAELEGSGIDTYVFSGEHVSKASRAEMERCRDFFARWFPEIEVYAYIRSPVKFAVSMFQQHLKFGALPTVENILPGYRERVENLDAVFGCDHVHLRAFDAADRRIPDILPDFLDWTGLEVGGEPQEWRNTSLSAEATALLYAVRRRLKRELDTSQEVRLWTRLVRRAEEVGDRKYGFDPGLFGKARTALLQDHAWVEARLGQRFPDPLAPDTMSLRFARLQEIRRLGLQIFKAETGKTLPRRDEDNVPVLKRALRLLGPPGS
jgi:hypothetical protein